MSKLVGFIFVVLLAFVVSPASADAISVTGADLISSRSTATGGITAFAGWNGVKDSFENKKDNGFQIAWVISDLGGGSWSYKYTISGVGGANLSKGLSHWILQLSDDVDWSNDDFGTAEDGIRTAGTPDGAKVNWNATDDGGSNFGMPGPIPGVKFDGGGSETAIMFSFTTDHAPIWGSFFAIDGKKKNEETYAYNSGLTALSNMPTFGTTDFTNWIATPDTTNGGVPEPAGLLLLGLGAVAVARRRRR